MYRAYKFRCYPNREQQIKILRNVSYARFLYNKMLEDSIAYYQQTKKMFHTTPAQYKKDYPFLKEADSLALMNAHQHLRTAFKNFFEQPKVGYPKFKSRHRSKWSYTTNVLNGNIQLVGHKIRLPKIGWINIRKHREPVGTLKSVTVSYSRSGRFFVSCMYEIPDQPNNPVQIQKTIGLDYSSPKLYVDNNGTSPVQPHFFRKSEEKLTQEQRKLSFMQKGSNNWLKQKKKVAKVHEHITNQRKDYLHKLSTQIANEYDLVGIETLNMKNMSRSLHLGKATMDNGWGMFTTFLEYKLKARGKQLVQVPWNYPSTKTCSACGNIKPVALSERIYVCPACGQVIDRDKNAAINIRRQALAIIG